MTALNDKADLLAVYPSLQGKRVLVTGGGSGIGAGIVEAFARQGCEVVFFDIAEAESQALAGKLGERVRFQRVRLPWERRYPGAGAGLPERGR